MRPACANTFSTLFGNGKLISDIDIDRDEMKQTFLFSFLLLVIRNYSSAEKITLGIDLNEPVAVTDPKFLSFTIDPVTLLAGNAVRYVQPFIYNK